MKLRGSTNYPSDIFHEETLRYDEVFKQAFANKILSKNSEWIIKVIRKMSKNSIYASCEEAKKYHLNSENRNEIDAVMEAGGTLAHISMYELESATQALKQELPDICNIITTTHRSVRVKYFMNNANLKTVGHALQVVKDTHVYSDRVLLDVFSLV